MLKWLRANNKKILAVLGVFLMIAFIIPSPAKRGGLFGSGRSVGTIGKVKIGADELAAAKQEWDVLKAAMTEYAQRTGSYLPGDGLLLAIASSEGVDDLSYLLLVKEAEQMQVRPNPAYVEDSIKAMTAAGMNVANIDQALLRWHMACENFEARIASATKFSPVIAEYDKLDQKQQVELSIVTFKADDFASQLARSSTQPTTQATTQPSEQQLSEFFDRFKDKQPGTGDFGYGYIYPKRLNIQYVMVPKDAIRSRLRTNFDVYRVYLQDKTRFIRLPELPTTEPSPTTVPTTLPSGTTQAALPALPAATRPAVASATTRPTTQPHQLTFDELTSEDLNAIRDQLAEQGAEALARQVATKMAEQYTRFHQADPAAIPNADVGVRYDTTEYLNRLAASVARSNSGSAANAWHDVRPLVNQQEIALWLALDKKLRSSVLTLPAARVLGDLDFQAPADSSGLVPLDDLRFLPGIGKIPTMTLARGFYAPFLDAVTRQRLAEDGAARASRLASLRQYRQQKLKELDSDRRDPDLAILVPRAEQDLQDINTQIHQLLVTSRPLELWEPSDPIRDPDGNYYVFRIVQAEAETPPASFAVYNNQKKVRTDFLEYQCYQLAKEAASKCFDLLQQAVREHNPSAMWDAASACGLKPEATERFSNEPGASPKQLPLSTQASAQFRKGAFDLLREKLRTGNEHPIGLIEVPYDKRVVVAQLDRSFGGVVNFNALENDAMELQFRAVQPALQLWFSPADIKQRMQFKASSETPFGSKNPAPTPPAGPPPIGL